MTPKANALRFLISSRLSHQIARDDNIDPSVPLAPVIGIPGIDPLEFAAGGNGKAPRIKSADIGKIMQHLGRSRGSVFPTGPLTTVIGKRIIEMSLHDDPMALEVPSQHVRDTIKGGFRRGTDIDPLGLKQSAFEGS